MPEIRLAVFDARNVAQLLDLQADFKRGAVIVAATNRDEAIHIAVAFGPASNWLRQLQSTRHDLGQSRQCIVKLALIDERGDDHSYRRKLRGVCFSRGDA